MPLYAKIDRATGAVLEYGHKDGAGRVLTGPQVWLPVERPAPPTPTATQAVVAAIEQPDLSDLQTPVPADAKRVEGWTVQSKPNVAVFQAIKMEARRRILALFAANETAALDKQRNAIARMVEIVEIPAAERTPAEAAELAAGKALWAKVKAIRAKSGAIEVDYEQLDAEAKAAFDPAADEHWT